MTILFLGVAVAPLIQSTVIEKSTIPISNGNTLYVGGSGPGNYTRIQDAIDDANPDDTVFVYDDSSPYHENITINKSIYLIGEDRNTTVIDDNSSECIIFIVSDDVSIHGFTIQNSMKYGIEIEYYFGSCTISNNIITNNFFDGISMHCSNNNIIKDNNFYENHAIYLSRCNNNTISDNTISQSIFDPFPRDGICIFNSRWNNISGNMIKDNQEGILLLLSEYNFIFNNTITSNKGYGMEIRDSLNNNIFGNNISYNNQLGINIEESANNNNLYHNNFIYNAINAIDFGNNIWDDGEYGNYWSDYREKYPFARKIWEKGIWDTPYEIPYKDNKDNYPLIKPWPHIKSKNLCENTASYSNYLFWILERFPLLTRLLFILR